MEYAGNPAVGWWLESLFLWSDPVTQSASAWEIQTESGASLPGLVKTAFYRRSWSRGCNSLPANRTLFLLLGFTVHVRLIALV